jgi:signal transduction histidine kinase/CheY-like chemotaxis protein
MKTPQLIPMYDLNFEGNDDSCVRDENSLFDQIVQVLKESVIVTNPDGIILTMNSAAQSLTRYTEPDAAGMDISTLFQTGQTDVQINSANYFSDQWKCICKLQEEGPVAIEGRTIPLKDDHGTHCGYILVFTRSNTEETAHSEKLITSHRIESMGILAGGMAHDFNNYLTGIINFINLAKFCTTSRQIELYLDNTLAIANDAQSLTKQFLKYSTHYEPVLKKILISRIINENISILFKGTNIKADLHVDENLSLCNVDEDKIRQLFGAIITNAREAMPDGGSIEISIKNENISHSEHIPLASGNYVRIQIRDNGCGMSPEIIKNIFKPYFTTKPGRSGLGLASAMIIAESHHGYITATSEVNTGSAFTVYIPAARTLNINTPQNENGPSQGKILVMDDEYYIRQTSSELLKKKHFDVSTATQGNDAIELYKSAYDTGAPFDAVILDLTVPEGLGGIETLRKLSEINPDVKAIASSGYSDDPVIVQPEKYGFTASLAKPYNLNEFLNCITSVLSK